MGTSKGEILKLTTGVELYYETRGRGRALAMVHGGMGLDHTYFLPWSEPLAGNMTLVLPDLRGNGRSPELPRAEYTYDKIVEDLHALRGMLGFERWAVLGHSRGGLIAQHYALKYPETIDHLILLNTAPTFSKLGIDDHNDLRTDRITPDQFAALNKLGEPWKSDNELKQWWHTMLPLYFHDSGAQDLFAKDRVIYRARASYWTRANESTFDVREKLGSLSMPTLIATGRSDWIAPARHSQSIHGLIPSSQLVLFEKSGHFPFIEEQSRFLEVISDFLAQTG